MTSCCANMSKKEDCFLPVGFVLDDRGRKVLPLDVIMRGMSQGTIMYKVKGPNRWYRRRYRVDVQNLRLTYSPSNKPFWRQRNQTIDIYDIDEVRKGWSSDVFNSLEARFRRSSLRSTFHPSLMAVLHEENCLSIVVSPNRRVIDLIAPNVHTRDAWVRGLDHLLATCKSSQKHQEYNRWLKDQVQKADVNNNGSLNFYECLTLLKQLNISMDRKEVQRLFNSANFRKSKIDGEDALDPEEFVHFYHSLTRRPELEELMKKHSVSRTTVMGAEEVQAFIQKEQKVFASLDECKMLIEKYEHQEDHLPREKVPGFLTLHGFQQMLLSVDHDIFNIKHRLIYQDMTHPLHHYYIASSHNTYLTAGQLIGSSSVEGYIEALQQGCRCLELDTWDGPDGEPIIFHGYTLTSRIFLRDVLETIKEYAFKASQYPVILSLENHCSLPYQVKMAEHFINILGDYLYKEPISENETEFPSPEALARKILIKAKKIKDAPDEEVALLEEEMEQEEVMAEVMQAEADEIDSSAEVAAAMPAPRHAVRLARELSNLVNYFCAVRFSSFQESESWKFYEMASFQESSGLKLSQDEGKDFVAYNKKHFSRVYPKGSRTDSSNYDPIPYWNVGCQLVALNFQTKDAFMRLHNSKFAQNGRCGYILKPQFLYDSEIQYSPLEKPHLSFTRHLLIRILTGQHIPKPNQATEGGVVDPYVVIKVSGHPVDVQKKKTDYILNNGFNPYWNEMFLIPLQMPELAMITFIVKDHSLTGKNEILGQYSLPFTSISEGYRHIHLEDLLGRPLVPASLFVHLTIGAYSTPSVYRKSWTSKNK